MADGKVIIDVGLNTGGLQKDIKGLPSKMGGISSSLKGIAAAAAAAFSVKALVDFGKAAVEIGSNVAEVQNVVDTAFGDMAYKAEAFADTAIEEFGMSALSAKKTASTYMSMARGMGMNEDAASDMSIALAGLTGDVASFYNISQELADVKLKSVFTGETETLKDLGVVMTQANLSAYAMEKGIAKSMDAMSQAELVALRYAYVTDSLSIAQGDFARTSSSWANQTRILSESWKEFMSVVGQGIIQVLTPLLQLLNRIISALTQMAKALIPSMSDGGASVAHAATGAGELAGNLQDATAEAKELKSTVAGIDELNVLSQPENNSTPGEITSTGASFGRIDTSQAQESANQIQNVFGGLREYIARNFSKSISAWSAAFGKMKDPAEKAFLSVGKSLSKLWSGTIAPFGKYLSADFIPTVVNGFSTTFAPIFGETMPVVFDEFSKDFEFACHKISQISADILKPAFEQVKITASGVFDGIKKSWDEHGAAILSGFQTFKESLRGIWDQVYGSVIRPVVDNVGGKVSELWAKHLKPLWDNVTNFLGSLAEALLVIRNEVLSPLVGYIIDWVAPRIRNAIDNMWSVISTVWGMIADVIGGVLKSLSGLLNFITGVFTADWKKAWTGVKDFFGGIWDAIWGIVRGVINLIIDGLNMLWKGVYSVVSGIVGAVGGVAGAIGDIFGQDWHFAMPSDPPLIPKLAQGAVLPPNKPFAAILSDQTHGRNLEAPESLIRQIVREESAGGIDRLIERVERLIDIVEGIDPSPVMVADGRIMAEAVDKANRARGVVIAR